MIRNGQSAVSFRKTRLGTSIQLVKQKGLRLRKEIYQRCCFRRSSPKHVLLIFGCQRSGTTLMGNVLAKDLRTAEVYVTFLQDKDEEAVSEAVEELNKASGFIRAELARQVVLKYLPHLRFHYNPSTRYAAQMDEIFHKIEPEDGPSPE